MPLPQEKFREVVFQMLYSWDFSQSDESDLIGLMMQELSITKKSAKEALERVKAIFPHLPAIDEQIRSASSEYQLDRISRVEKNIIRLGIFELCYDPDLPKKVAISEAVRLCRKFGTRESSRFVNAILDSIHKGFEECPLKTASEPTNS